MINFPEFLQLGPPLCLRSTPSTVYNCASLGGFMKRYLGWLLVLTCGGLCQLPAAAQTAADPVQKALEDEAKRAMIVLTQKGNPKPYFLSYLVNETKSAEVTTSLGALQYSNADKQRLLDIEVRVGDYNFDNTHQIRGQRGGGGDQLLNRPGSVLMPIDDDVDALKSVIWLETDRRYKQAVERLIKIGRASCRERM